MITHLMVIDDNDDDQMLCRRIIERSGLVENAHQFVLAKDALIFLREPTCPAIDAILLDVNMPGMNGFEFLDAATEEFGDSFVRLAFIMLTTPLLDEHRRRASQHAIVKGYLDKPLEKAHLEKIGRMLTA